MLRVVLDSTILFSAFLNAVPGGVSFDVLRRAGDEAFELFTSQDILDETARVLLTSKRIRARYNYPAAAVADYWRNVALLTTVLSSIPDVKIVRDPADDMIVGCAVAAKADYLVTRDDGLLSLCRYGTFEIVAPEDFLAVLRGGRRHTNCAQLPIAFDVDFCA